MNTKNPLIELMKEITDSVSPDVSLEKCIYTHSEMIKLCDEARGQGREKRNKARKKGGEKSISLHKEINYV